MAYIQFENANVQRFHNDEYMPEDYRITEISDKGVAQVTAEVHDNLVESDLAIRSYDGGGK